MYSKCLGSTLSLLSLLGATHSCSEASSDGRSRPAIIRAAKVKSLLKSQKSKVTSQREWQPGISHTADFV